MASTIEKKGEKQKTICHQKALLGRHVESRVGENGNKKGQERGGRRGPTFPRGKSYFEFWGFTFCFGAYLQCNQFASLEILCCWSSEATKPYLTRSQSPVLLIIIGIAFADVRFLLSSSITYKALVAALFTTIFTIILLSKTLFGVLSRAVLD